MNHDLESRTNYLLSILETPRVLTLKAEAFRAWVLLTLLSEDETPFQELARKFFDGRTQRATEIVVGLSEDGLLPFFDELNLEDDNLTLMEPIGENPAKKVAETRSLAFQLYGGTTIPVHVDVWLASYPADRVMLAMNAATKNKAKHPIRYIEALLKNPNFGVQTVAADEVMATIGRYDAERASWSSPGYR